MRQPQVFQCFKDILGEHVEVKPESTAASLGMDSIDAIEFLFHLEETFNIEIPDEDAETWRTAADVVATINRATGV